MNKLKAELTARAEHQNHGADSGKT
jgi:hypothetical protein